MFLPFEPGEIHGALQLAYQVINIGWSNVHDAHQQYRDFKQDVEGLTKQLESLQLTIEINRARTGARLAPRGQLSPIFDNFRETLEACRRLLESQARHGTHQGPLFNIQWFMLVRDEVTMLRDRIAVLHLKLSLALQSLEIESRDGQTELMLSLTTLILDRLDVIESRMSRVLGEPPPAETKPPQRLSVPRELEEFLESTMAARCGGPTNIPMCQGVDEVVFYLDRATEWHVRQQSAQPDPAFQWANIYRAYWLLQATKASDEYQAASSTLTVAQLEQDLPRLGMTARRFFTKLEKQIVQAHAQLAQSADGGPPSSNLLLETIRRDSNAWQEHEVRRPLQEEDDNPRRGERVAVCRLRGTNATPEQLLEIYREKGNQEHLTIITSGPGRADRVHDVDLRFVHLAPSIEAVRPNGGPYSVTLSTTNSRGEGGFRLAFQSEEDAFEFQESMTGYKVVDDYPNTVVTRQHAGRVLGGERRSDTGRVQLWSSSRRSAGFQLPEEFREPEHPSAARRTTEPRTVSPYAPVLGSLGSFSRLSLTPRRTRSSSARSVLPDQQPTQGQRRQSAPSLARASTITSSTSRSSNSSLGGIFERPTNLIQVDRHGNMGYILDQPDPARLTIFLPAEDTTRAARGSGPSLLVIDINQYIRIDPTLCDCQQEATLHHRSSTGLAAAAPEQQQQQRCKKVVLRACGGASGVTARKTVGTWNLAAAGRYQALGRERRREAGGMMVEVPRVNKVAVGFGGVEG
ncbi:hypothetical protein F5144DRAFT_581216 [Chaetomium tenue]|uniref:Uncharacterized protein n=1 Tax=Chaetomium tenue TaxID=1854479 RepID=A0ACB7NYM1_9PEZI|nr:hypothetical protein F5144DRAFT_581216 [Chaetomium globosum]